MPRPTKKQTELLEYLKGFIGAAGYALVTVKYKVR